MTGDDQLTCSNQHGLSGLGGVLMHVAGQRGVILCEVRGGQVLQHHVAILDGIRFDHHRIFAHLSSTDAFKPLPYPSIPQVTTPAPAGN